MLITMMAAYSIFRFVAPSFFGGVEEWYAMKFHPEKQLELRKKVINSYNSTNWQPPEWRFAKPGELPEPKKPNLPNLNLKKSEDKDKVIYTDHGEVTYFRIFKLFLPNFNSILQIILNKNNNCFFPKSRFLRRIGRRRSVCTSTEKRFLWTRRPPSSSFKNFLLKILVMRANFGDFGILISTSKFWKNLVRIVTPYWDQFWKILIFEFWWNRKVMINHRGGILIFCQILSKMKILDFRVKDLKFWILGLRISNFEISPILSISAKFSSNL